MAERELCLVEVQTMPKHRFIEIKARNEGGVVSKIFVNPVTILTEKVSVLTIVALGTTASKDSLLGALESLLHYLLALVVI